MSSTVMSSILHLLESNIIPRKFFPVVEVVSNCTVSKSVHKIGFMEDIIFDLNCKNLLMNTLLI